MAVCSRPVASKPSLWYCLSGNFCVVRRVITVLGIARSQRRIRKVNSKHCPFDWGLNKSAPELHRFHGISKRKLPENYMQLFQVVFFRLLHPKADIRANKTTTSRTSPSSEKFGNWQSILNLGYHIVRTLTKIVLQFISFYVNLRPAPRIDAAHAKFSTGSGRVDNSSSVG